MSLPVILRPEAQQEYDAAFDYYDAQRPGLGQQFADRVNEVLTHIGNNPRMHGAVLADVRKAVVSKFPYCVYYREVNGTVEILAVFHTSRDPSAWQSRV